MPLSSNRLSRVCLISEAKRPKSSNISRPIDFDPCLAFMRNAESVRMVYKSGIVSKMGEQTSTTCLGIASLTLAPWWLVPLHQEATYTADKTPI